MTLRVLLAGLCFGFSLGQANAEPPEGKASSVQELNELFTYQLVTRLTQVQSWEDLARFAAGPGGDSQPILKEWQPRGEFPRATIAAQGPTAVLIKVGKDTSRMDFSKLHKGVLAINGKSLDLQREMSFGELKRRVELLDRQARIWQLTWVSEALAQDPTASAQELVAHEVAIASQARGFWQNLRRWTSSDESFTEGLVGLYQEDVVAWSKGTPRGPYRPVLFSCSFERSVAQDLQGNEVPPAAGTGQVGPRSNRGPSGSEQARDLTARNDAEARRRSFVTRMAPCEVVSATGQYFCASRGNPGWNPLPLGIVRRVPGMDSESGSVDPQRCLVATENSPASGGPRCLYPEVTVRATGDTENNRVLYVQPPPRTGIRCGYPVTNAAIQDRRSDPGCANPRLTDKQVQFRDFTRFADRCCKIEGCPARVRNTLDGLIRTANVRPIQQVQQVPAAGAAATN